MKSFLAILLLAALAVADNNSIFDDNKAYNIRNKKSGLYLTPASVHSGQSNILQFAKAHNDNLQKVYIKQKNGANNKYYIHSYANPGNVYDITGGVNTNGAALQIYPKHGGNNQLFEITQNADFSFTIKAVGSGKVLDVNGGSVLNGAQVIQYDAANSDNQKFFIDF